jgi:hypothetical protein
MINMRQEAIKGNDKICYMRKTYLADYDIYDITKSNNLFLI